MRRLLAPALGIVVLGACRDTAAPDPKAQPSFSRNLPDPGARGITVMTRNIYLGADLGPVLTAPPAQVPFAVAQTFAKIQATNFPERAGRLADEIVATRADLVGLQEVELYRRQSPGDAIGGGTTPATEVVIDFLQLLRDSLAARGLAYVPAATNLNFDGEAPAFAGIGPSGPMFDDIRITDYNVILARADVPTANPQSANYALNLEVSIGGVPLTILRGWASVDATVAGVTFRFVDTHLETQVAPPIQEAQASELIGMLASESRPVLLVGDFNSAANMFQTRSYGLFTDAGYIDAWAQKHPGDPGLSCCQAPDLLNAQPTLDQRLDIVFWRDAFSAATGRIVGGVHVDIVGEAPADRTASGLWPSDHAGVAATLTLPPDVARN